MALASTVPSSGTCRSVSCLALAAVIPVGARLELVLSGLPPNIGQSGWDCPFAVALAPSSRHKRISFLMSKVSHQRVREWMLQRGRGHEPRYGAFPVCADCQTLVHRKWAAVADESPNPLLLQALPR